MLFVFLLICIYSLCSFLIHIVLTDNWYSVPVCRQVFQDGDLSNKERQKTSDAQCYFLSTVRGKQEHHQTNKAQQSNWQYDCNYVVTRFPFQIKRVK